MGERNASASALGWDFQVNAAILLMLENIKEAEKIRIEGADEDIEITLIDGTKIYSQVKCVAKPDDYTNIIEKLTGALETLNLDAKNNDGSLFTYITNSPNPFNNQKTMSYFSSRTHLYYDELPEQAQNKISELISRNGYGNLDTNMMDIRVIPFHGRDPKNRYKWIQESINELLVNLEMPTEGISSKIMEIWQRDFFQNATQPETDITISKSKMIWPLIVLIIDRAVANDYKKDFDDDEISVIERKYKSLINSNFALE